MDMEVKDCEVRPKVTKDSRIAEDDNEPRWGRM